MKQLTFRLQTGQFLKEEIDNRCAHIGAGVLLSIVGGLHNAVLRMSGSEPEKQIIKEWKGPLEIVAGTGTISKDGSHIHIALSNQEGDVIGGHLRNGCAVTQTVEVVIGIFEDVSYSRSYDPKTGFKELEVEDVV